MRRHSLFSFLFGVVVFAAVTGRAAGVTVKPGDRGFAVDAGGGMTFEVGYPVALGDKGEEGHRITGQSVTGDAVVLRYEGGGRADINCRPDGSVTMDFSGFGEEVKSFSLAVRLEESFAAGSRWRFGEEAFKPFPGQKPEKPFIYDATATALALADGKGRAIRFELPPYTYNQIVDLREWDDRGFLWKAFLMIDHNQPTLNWSVSAYQEKSSR